ncbi:MAG: beta-hydroxyacyl-ACP dehydratase [Alphaproteobacteria bacterium]|nr:MAG: beta-hydroxyacyl-ACP dehydratase [Alphaproteobacteria bacterium]
MSSGYTNLDQFTFTKHNDCPLDKDVIEDLIPHRDPFLFLDCVDLVDVFNGAVGYRKFGHEDFFRGHFPNFKVVPGVILVEAMAQLAAFCVAYSNKAQNQKVPGGVAFMKIEQAKFRKPVIPNDLVKIIIVKTLMKTPIFQFYGECYVNNQKVAESSFMATSKD